MIDDEEDDELEMSGVYIGDIQDMQAAKVGGEMPHDEVEIGGQQEESEENGYSGAVDLMGQEEGEQGAREADEQQGSD